MTSDIVTNKIETILRCLQRIREEYDNNPENLNNFTKQDSIILNLQRACEASIDLSMHIVSERSLGVPQTSREAFDLLETANIIDSVLCTKMKAMVGFRNIAVHTYQRLQLEVVRSVIEKHLEDFMGFAEQIKKA